MPSGTIWINAISVMPSQFGAVGDLVADDYEALQTWIDFCRENNLKGVVDLDAKGYRIGSKLRTQTTINYAPIHLDFLGKAVEAAFDDDDAFLIEGSFHYQTIAGMNFKPAEGYKYTGTYSGTACGVRVLNARHNIEGRSTEFKGDNIVFESTAVQMNGSRHDVNVQVGGRGIHVIGSQDDISVIDSRIRAYGNGREGIRVDDASAMRQWRGFWNCEANWTESPSSTNYAVYIGKSLGSELWIYSEQSNSAGEIFVRSAGCFNNRIYSARQNKDSIGGSNTATVGRDFYQNEPGVRPAEPMRFVGKLARTHSASEYVRVPFVGNGDVIMGYIYAEQQQIGSKSQNGNNFCGVDQRRAINNKEHIYGADIVLSAASSSQSVVLGTLTAGTMLTGTLKFSGRANSSGNGAKILKTDFYCQGLTLTTGTPSVNVEPGTLPPIVTLSVNGSNQLTAEVSYSSAQWGPSYQGVLSVTIVSFGIF
ncbi:hypothetical protein M6D81_06780 [Paenibacillus sp. J5C_2022]|uniref:hypothetical protein n=1 Tax=Paenibacillus sp. J5C2022 TaxID=2977129 RepID=UPI0021D1E89B|nr:hypothetical protein [Paenibacillus sp. J5C2022]MCU6708417.1 hypothetical protein [Paenibacillus sp. J5C2022]